MMKLSTCAQAVGGIWTGRVIEKLLAELKILKGGTIGLLGLASKPQWVISGKARPLKSPVNLRNAVSRWQAQDPAVPTRARRELPNTGIYRDCLLRRRRTGGQRRRRPRTGHRIASVPRPAVGISSRLNVQPCGSGYPPLSRQAAPHPCRLWLHRNRKLNPFLTMNI